MTANNLHPKNRQKRNKDNLKNYARYSSLAFQMAAIIAGGTIGGIYLDKWLDWSFPVFTLVLVVFSVIMAIYFAVKDVIKK